MQIKRPKGELAWWARLRKQSLLWQKETEKSRNGAKQNSLIATRLQWWEASRKKKSRKSKKEEVEEEEDHERQMRTEVTKGIIAGVLKEADTVGGGVTGNTVEVSQNTNFKVSGKYRKSDWRRGGGRIGICAKNKDSVAAGDGCQIGMKTMS